MNYRKGELRPLTVLLKLDPADAAMLDTLARSRHQRSAQATILGILRDYHRFREQTQDERVENIEWRERYFALAESTSALRIATAELLQQLDAADAHERIDHRRRLSLA